MEEVYRYRLGDIGFPISKGSPYKIFLEQAIKDITESGKLERLQKKWMKPKPDCSPILLTGKVLNFQKLAGPFMVFIVGLVLTFFTMIAEVIVANVIQNNGQEEDKNISSKKVLSEIAE